MHDMSTLCLKFLSKSATFAPSKSTLLLSEINGTLRILFSTKNFILSNFIESMFLFFNRNSFPNIASNPFNLLDIMKFAQHVITVLFSVTSLNFRWVIPLTASLSTPVAVDIPIFNGL